MKFLLLVCIASLALVNCETRAKHQFSFYITSRCPDTQNFVKTQLNPVFQEFKEYMNVEFIPWGKAKRQPNGEIECQFGPTDCAANRFQSCALHLLNGDGEKQMEYIFCEMSTLSSVSQSYHCIDKLGIDATAEKQCIESDLGDRLQSLDEQKTNAITMVFVPTIVYENKYDLQNQNAAFANFRKFVCDKIDDPSVCN